MNEIVLINMLSEIDPSLLQNDCIDKDLKKGILSYLLRLFKKTTSELEYNPLNQTLQEEDNVSENSDTIEIQQDQEANSNAINPMATHDYEENTLPENRGLSISIFKKNIRNLIKIISGIAAAFILIIGIVMILLKRHKSIAKLYEKKIQIIY